MTKLILSSVAAVLLLAVASAQAGDACCKAGKTAAKSGGASVWSELKVSPDQQAKIDALKAECDKGGCSKEAHGKFMTGVQEILTADQLAQFKALCDKEGKSGSCPFAAGQGKKDS